ncbi:hypothetical protein DIU36_21195 [Mucilaginibacter rubeus]|nr:hypothetical protein DIU36_21195 [Mucilaginibacter rubeus]
MSNSRRFAVLLVELFASHPGRSTCFVAENKPSVFNNYRHQGSKPYFQQKEGIISGKEIENRG